MSKRIEIFQDILNKYESSEIRDFCIDMLESAPQNFWSWATTSYDFAGGLIVQTLLGCIECELLIRSLNIDKPKKRDCVRAAVMFRYVFPRIILDTKVEHDIKMGLRKYIAGLIFGDDSYENKFVRQCHYSSMDTEHVFSKELRDKITDVALPDPENYFFRHGPYKNMNWYLVYEMDKDYLYWLRDSCKYRYVEEPLRTYLLTKLEERDDRIS